MEKDCNEEKPFMAMRFNRRTWVGLNSFYLLVGLGIGVILTLLISTFKGGWIGYKTAFVEVLFSTVITLCITNTIYVSIRLLKFGKDRIVLFLMVYYLASILGMLIAIELIYLIISWVFNQPYHFFHSREATFSSMIVIIVSTIIYTYTSQKERLNARIREKDVDMVQLKQIKTQAELAALQSKINPHFLYNSLNAIASLIHENPDKAEDMTLKLSKLFRYSINQNQEDLVEVRKEIDLVNTYLDIEKVRFGDRIRFLTNVDESLLRHKIPRFLIQPLVENALKHGLKDIINDGELIISITENDGIVISIADNGTPFPKELEVGYGLQSTYDKLSLLYGVNYEVQIVNSPLKQIRIKLPLHNV